MEILAPTSSSSHGGTDSDPVTEFLRTFETEIDTSFVALPNLVDVACALNPDVEASDLLPRQLWEQWQRRHRAALQYVAEKELGKAESTRRAGNPLGGAISKFPVVACLLQDPVTEVAGKYHGFSVLLLIALIFHASNNMETGKGGPTRRFRTVSDELRRAVTNIRSSRQGTLRALPEFDPTATEKSLEVLTRKIESLLSAPPSVGGQKIDLDFLKALRRLVAACGVTSRSPQKPTRPERAPARSTANPRAHPRASSANAEATPELAGTPPATSGNIVEEEAGGSAQPVGEPRDHRIRLLAHRPEAPISRTGLLAEGRQIGNWFMRSRRRVPVDRGLLNPIERRRLSLHIQRQLSEHGRECGAFLLGLMYVTGLDLNSILDATLGIGGVLGKGLYRRPINVPDDSYTPSAKEAGAWTRPSTYVELPLPAIIGGLLPATEESDSGTLGEFLGLTESAAEKLLHRDLEALRSDGQYPGMHRQRIPAQLGVALSAYERNPAILYHLVGGASPPSLVYYLAVPLPALVAAYERATARLLRLS